MAEPSPRGASTSGTVRVVCSVREIPVVVTMSIEGFASSGVESPPAEPLLDSSCESRTRGDVGDSSPEACDSDSGESEDSTDWNRQQKRVYHRVQTLLSYWEQHDYQIRWITLTSSPESDDASQLAYNHRRLRQTVERARLAKDADGKAYRLSHINEIESLVIRTSEGPDGKGVLHLFWAWKPLEGQHSRDFFVPHDWLSKQWGRIHGPHELRSLGELEAYNHREIEGLHVWVERVGSADYHSRKNLAGYCVSQYLGDHGEALENISWSWERSLGGSVTDAWDAVTAIVDSLEEAVEIWDNVLGGEEVRFSPDSGNVDYTQVVKPPPNLSVEVSGVTVTPPDEYRTQGPDVMTVRRMTRKLPEHDGGTQCPVCGQGGVFELAESFGGRLHPSEHSDRVRYYCLSCEAELAEPGDGDREVYEKEFDVNGDRVG